MKRNSLFVLILFLLVFFNISFLQADDKELLIVKPFKISDFTQILVLPLNSSSTVFDIKNVSKIKLNPPIKETLNSIEINESFMEGFRNISKKKMKIIASGNQDPKTLILKCMIPKIGFNIFSNEGIAALAEVKGVVMDAQYHKTLLHFKVSRKSSGTISFVEKLLKNDFEEIGEDIANILTKTNFTHIDSVKPRLNIGCIDKDLKPIPKCQPLSAFNTLMIAPFNGDAALVEEEKYKGLPHDFAAETTKLLKEKIEESHLFNKVIQSPDCAENAIKIDGMIYSLDHSKGTFYVGNCGQIINCQNGEVLYKFDNWDDILDSNSSRLPRQIADELTQT
jgi:hypothetical protein